MPSYLTRPEIWVALWPIPLAAVIVSVLGMLLAGNCSRSMLLSLLAFAMLGLVVGNLAGLSREPALGAVLPAVLSLIGALAIYLMGQQPERQVYIGVLILVFAVDLLLGACWGAEMRGVRERYQTSPEYRMQRALGDQRVRTFIEALDLEPDSSR